MDKTTFRRVAEQFHALVELPAEQREAGLQALEAESTTLAQQVRALLRADDLDSPGVLDESLQAVAPELGAARLPSAGAEPGQRCGPWTLLEPLGEGGMGEVWRAERSEGGFAQRVALKLLKRGMDSAAILKRFLQERRILARLRHPNIVHLIDGGMSEDGRPWFAMELVDGLGLHEHARRQALDPRERVALAARIADVIAYAHGELVVHRDLKPSNILVDEEGQPRLLDFGIAKLLADTEDPALTGTGVRLLSPAYAAPEQIRGQPVGTYTDIYALGVILYELLTGALPHRRSSNDLLALARELDQDQGTERLSRKLLTASSGELERVYADASAAQRFARLLDRDLSTVLSRALQPDPQRRYASASAFAADLRAWLEGRPVSARPDSRAYRLRRFVTRNIGAVVSAALVLLSLSGGLAAALWQAEQARNQAVLAQQQGERALRVKDFVIALFQETEGVGRSSGEQRTPLQLVEAGIERALEDLANDPLLQDEVLGDLLDIQVNLGAANAALPQLEQREAFRRSSFGAQDPRLAAALASRITALFQLGRFPDAEPLIDEALRILVAQHGEIHHSVAAMRNRMVRVRLAQTRFEEAAALMQEVIATQEATLGPDSAEVGLSLSNLATVLMRLQRKDEARVALTRALSNLERARGPEHASLTFPLVTLGDVERSDARFAEALPHYSRALELTRVHMGAGHPRTAVAYNRVGAIQRRLGQLEEAEASLRSALEIQEPQGYAELGDTYGGLGELAIAHGEIVQSLDWFEKAFQFQLRTQGPANNATWRRRAEYCEVLQGLGRLQHAETCALETETALEALEARGLADLYAVRVLRAHGLLRAGQPQAAITLLEPGLARLQEQLPTAHVLHALAQLELAAALERRRGDGDLDRAQALLDAAEPRIDSAGPRAVAMLALTRLRLSEDADARALQRPQAEELASRAGVHRPWLESELAALR